MASVSVGSVTVDVVPSVRDFARQMRREILPEATRIGREAGQRIQRGIQRAVRPINIRVDMGQTLAQLVRLNRALDRIDGRRVEFEVRAKVGTALGDLDSIRVTLRELARRRTTVSIHVEMSGAMAELRALEQILTRIDRRRIRINVNADGASSALTRLSGSSGVASRSLGVLGKAVSLMRLPALAAGAVLAGAGLIQFAANLAPVIGLTAALPIVLSSAVAGLATLILALKGTGAAFGAALGEDATKFEESLKGLAPAAQTAARELRSVRPALVGIRTAAQQAMFKPLEGQIARLVKAVAGPLRVGVRRVAGEFGLAARSVLRFGASAKTVASVNSGFIGLRRSVALMRPALVPVLAGFRDLSIAGIPALLRMSAAVGDVGQRFGEWMSRLAESGRVTEIIGGALDVLKQIGGFLADLGGIIGSVFAAAQQAGTGLFGVLGPILNQLNAFLKTAAAQQAMTAFFQALSVVGNAVAQVFVSLVRALAPLLVQLAQGLAPIFTALVPIFQQAFAALAPVISALLAGLQPAIAALVPVIGVLVGAIGQILLSLAPILPVLGQFIAQLLAGLLPVLTPIIQLMAQVIAQVGQALVQALMQSLPALQQIVLAVASLLPALMPLIPLWGEWLVTILPLVPILLQLVAVLVGYLAPVLRFLITVLVKIWTTVASLILPVFRLMVTVIGWVASLVQPIFHGIWVAIQTIGRWAMWLWTNAIGPAFRFIGAVAKWLYQIIVVAVIGPILLQFKAWATVAKWLYGSVISPVFRAIGTVIRWVWNSLIRPVFNALNSVIRNVIAPVFRWIYNSVIRPVWNAVGTAIRWVWNTFIRPAFNAVRDHVRQLAGHFRNAVDAIGRAWDKLKSAARKPVQYVVDVVYNKGIVKIWNAVAGLVPGVGKLNPIQFARGGVVGAGQYGVLPGYAPGRDTMLAAVSPGEGWIRPDATRALGSGFIHGINRAAVSGGSTGAARWLADNGGMQFGLGGIVGGFLKSAKDLFTGGLVKTARKAFNPMLDLAQRSIGGTPFGDMAMKVTRGMAAQVLKAFGPLEEKIGGDGRKVVKVAEKYVGLSGNPNRFTRRMGMNGLPWCGMFVDGVFSEANSKKALRGVGGTALVANYTSLPRVSRGAARPGDLGLYRGDAGHINIYTGKGAWTIGGNESNSVRKQSGYINSASSIRRPRFARGGIVPQLLTQDLRENNRHSTPLATQLLRGIAGQPLLFDDGGWLPTGTSMVYNRTGAPEPVLTDAQWARVADATTGGDGGTHYHAHLDGMTRAAYEQQVRSAFGAMQVERGRRDRTGRRR